MERIMSLREDSTHSKPDLKFVIVPLKSSASQADACMKDDVADACMKDDVADACMKDDVADACMKDDVADACMKDDVV